MYRSSVCRFIQGVLSLIDAGRDLTFDDVAELSDYTVGDLLSALRTEELNPIRAGMPPDDWNEIMAYIGRFTVARGPRGLQFYERSFLCWLAAIGVELLSDL